MTGYPTVSVVIPTYNKAKTLADCVRAVYRQTHQPVEVIVVDDASTDGSREIAAGLPCRLICLPTNQGVSAARNAGAAAAIGEVLFFVDSDIALAPDAIGNALRVLREHPGCAVVQGIYDAEPLAADGPVEVYKTLFEHYWRRQRDGVADATLFALTAIRRQAFDDVGGFDERLRDAEDIEFGTRLPARYEIRMSADVVGRHDDVDRLRPFLAEHVRRAVSYGALLVGVLVADDRRRVHRADGQRPETARPASGVDVGAVAAMLCCAATAVTLPLAAVAGWLLAVPAATFTAFTLVDGALFRFVRRRKGNRFLVYFVAMHFLMHTTQLAGMTVGFAAGLVRSTRRRPARSTTAPETGR
ncbi:glycosyltransferase family 2 protein [Solwaraspora sp. WMMD792]|uniref:glycosyltransferase family 2 protein n=1 Tax=Solwaraspora sp. WMMD792 TaxID=3016099 RepID=UPI002417DBC0|nr:glycosyltransferase family 2 protein [Solwaraspora sp. WMMD792]MDG4770749.1 glycosyltransferase [Solwaraspora sp. WMMD792]